MLSKKYLKIKKCLTHISQIGPVHRKLIVLAQMYVDIDKGFRFSYMPDENGEVEFLDAIKKIYAGKNFKFFDVGAHFGTYTDMLLKRFADYEGHLFEPTKKTFETCTKRHGDNKKLKINNAALSDTAGDVEYRIYEADPTRNGISGVGPEAGLKYVLDTVSCWTGDQYCRDNNTDRIHLLKIDAEGYDLHVMKGFNDMLDQGKIDIIQFEYNVKNAETHTMLGDFYALLDKKGYITGPLRQEGVKFETFNFLLNDFKKGPNYIACLPAFRDKLANFK